MNGHHRVCWSWWRHQMEIFSTLLALYAGNSTVPVNSPHEGQWSGALMFSLICAWINDWVNNHEDGDLRQHCAHYDVNVMIILCFTVLGNQQTQWWSRKRADFFSIILFDINIFDADIIVTNFNKISRNLSVLPGLCCEAWRRNHAMASSRDYAFRAKPFWRE